MEAGLLAPAAVPGAPGDLPGDRGEALRGVWCSCGQGFPMPQACWVSSFARGFSGFNPLVLSLLL